MLENYKPLKEWLFSERLNAQCLWQRGVENDSMIRIEAWAINGRVVIILLHAQKRGWEIYTNADTNDIPTTLRDAELRIGLVTP